MTSIQPTVGMRPGERLQQGLFIFMELAWIAALALFLDAAIAGEGTVAAALVCALYPLAMVADNALGRLRPARWISWTAHIAAFGAGTLAVSFVVLSSSPEGLGRLDRPWTWLTQDVHGTRFLALVGLCLFCWVRGAFLSGRQLTAYAVALGFQIGLVVLLSVLGLSAAFELALPGAAVLTFAFVTCGLLALWHVRATLSAGRSGAPRREPVSALIGLSMVLVLGLTIGAAVDRSILDAMVALASRVASEIGELIVALFRLLPDMRPDPASLPESSGGAAPMPAAPQEQMLALPESVRSIFATVTILTFVLLIAVILFANLRELLAWLKRRRRYTPGLDHDRSPFSFRDTVRQVWEAFLRLLGGAYNRIRGALAYRRRDKRPQDQLRRAYVRLSRELDLRGWPRHPHETPYDYVERMRSEWPAPAGDLQTLTTAYVNARYGRPRSVPSGRLRRLWKKIRRSLAKVRQKETYEDNSGRPAEQRS